LRLADAAELREAEAEIVVVRDADIRVRILPGKYDLDHLQRFHKVLFGDVYDWAGEIRAVPIGKGVPFANPEFIGSLGGELLAGLRQERLLVGLSQHAFVDRLAYYLGEVNALHPFREGNGRTQRAFFRQLAASAGYRLDWAMVARDENNEASYRSLVGDGAPLRTLIGRITEKLP
jgi:cell filamentation protein